MSSKISLWTGLIGIGATIAIVQPSIASAKSSVEIGETARAITVLITAPKDETGFISNGSGVILQHQGDIYTVITAAHVVKEKVNYKITTPDDRSYEVISSSIRSAPGSIDLAVVKFKSTTNYPTAKLGNCNLLEIGMDLYVSGFPAKTRAINESTFVFMSGKVSANSNKIFENGYSLIYSNITQPGMSGGAVLNSDGELVAIHGRGDRDEDRIKTGLNLGIPINRFATVASNMGVNLDGQVAPIPQNTALKPDDYFAAAAQKYRKGDHRGALADLNQAIVLDPKYALAYLGRGILKSQNLNDVQGALADYNKSIVLDPKYALAYFGRGFLKHEKLNDVQGALADYNQSIVLDPKNTGAYLGRGFLKSQKLNDVQGALADYNQSIALNPKNALAYLSRGLVKYSKLNDVRGALADLTNAIEFDPSSADGYYNRGDLFYSAGNKSAAIADFRKVVEIDYSGDYQGLTAEGIIQTQRGAYPQAIDLFNQAAKISPETGDIYKYRGEAYKQQGDRAAAIRDWRKAAQSYQKANSVADYKIVISWLKSLGASE